MPQQEVERTVQWSVLDRLIDANPDTAVEPPLTWAQSVRELKRGLRRDLEWLLNTRRIVVPAPEGLTELQQSLYHYGLPDITSASAESTDTRNWLRRQVEETIRLFEPRLTDVHVTVQAVGDAARREVRFVVEALLQMEPSPEQVVFDTVLEISSATFEVKGTAGAAADA
jgi:type VI secretion system protein ImpF